MRTKAEITAILTRRKTRDTFQSSTWPDLVRGIQTLTAQERDGLLTNIIRGQQKAVLFTLRKALEADAATRAKADVDTALANDALSLDEIDSLI